MNSKPPEEMPAITQPNPPGPGDRIEVLTGRRHLSWSQLSSYRRCPRQWFFSHVEQVEPAFIASSLIFGGSIHAAVQHYFEQQLAGQEATHEQLVEVFAGYWDAEQRDASVEIKYSKDESRDSLFDLARRMLEAFMASPPMPTADDLQLIAIEETFTLPVHEALPDFTARIDVMWQAQDTLHLMDFKTSRSRWTQAKCDESSDQLRLYAHMARQAMDTDNIQLHFGVMTKAKKPVIQNLQVDIPADDKIDDIVTQALPIFEGMMQGIDFTNPNPMNCSTCPYRPVCPSG